MFDWWYSCAASPFYVRAESASLIVKFWRALFVERKNGHASNYDSIVPAFGWQDSSKLKEKNFFPRQFQKENIGFRIENGRPYNYDWIAPACGWQENNKLKEKTFLSKKFQKEIIVYGTEKGHSPNYNRTAPGWGWKASKKLKEKNLSFSKVSKREQCLWNGKLHALPVTIG